MYKFTRKELIKKWTRDESISFKDDLLAKKDGDCKNCKGKGCIQCSAQYSLLNDIETIEEIEEYCNRGEVSTTINMLIKNQRILTEIIKSYPPKIDNIRLLNTEKCNLELVAITVNQIINSLKENK